MCGLRMLKGYIRANKGIIEHCEGDLVIVDVYNFESVCK